MKLRFPYSFHGLALSVPARPILETWRPFASGCLVGKEGASWQFRRALLDTGSDDTVFPLSAAEDLKIHVGAQQHMLVWRGQRHGLVFAEIDMELHARDSIAGWRSKIGFTLAPLLFPILGIRGCLQYFTATFLGDERVTVLEPNRLFTGEIQRSR